MKFVLRKVHVRKLYRSPQEFLHDFHLGVHLLAIRYSLRSEHSLMLRVPVLLLREKKCFESQKTSTHYFIDREGKVHCWLPEELAAINAGAGTFGVSKYLNNMNEYAISIELAAIGSCNDMSGILTKEDYNLLSAGVVGYTKAQHESLKLLLEDICGRYKIPYDRQHIIGHSDYNEKKKEPGELFDWSAVGLR